MKKLIVTAVAVGATVCGGIAHADLIDGVGSTIANIFGVPYDPTPPGRPNFPAGTVYTDANGTNYQVDAAGRHIPLGNTQVPYAVAPYPAAPAVAVAPTYDDDRDGVANPYDRYPYDGRYR